MSKTTFDQFRTEALEKLQTLQVNPFGNILTADDLSKAKQQTISRTTRKRKFPPRVLFWMYIFRSLFGSFRETLNTIWTSLQLGRETDQQVTPSGFTHARDRFSLSFFETIWTKFIQLFQERFDRSVRTFKGYLPLAVDGSKVNLPSSDELLDQFGGPTGTKGGGDPNNTQAVLTGVVNVLTGVCLDYLLRPYATHESPLFRSLIEQLPDRTKEENPLFLLDRGYCNHKNILACTSRNMHFLMRVKKSMNYQILSRIGPGDFRVRIRISKNARGDFPNAPTHVTLRLVRYQIKGFRPKQVLTNLPGDEFTRNELVGLYHFRWRVEVFYRELKNTLSVRTIRSRKPSGVRKEIAAQLLFNNLVRHLMAEASQQDEAVPILYSFQDSLRIIEKTIETMLVYGFEKKLSQGTKVELLRKTWRIMMNELPKNRINKRPGRWFHRDLPHATSRMPDPEYEEPIDDQLVFLDPVDIPEIMNSDSRKIIA